MDLERSFVMVVATIVATAVSAISAITALAAPTAAGPLELTFDGRHEADPESPSASVTSGRSPLRARSALPDRPGRSVGRGQHH